MQSLTQFRTQRRPVSLQPEATPFLPSIAMPGLPAPGSGASLVVPSHHYPADGPTVLGFCYANDLLLNTAIQSLDTTSSAAAAAAQATADTALANAATAQTTANSATTTANAALPKAGGTMTGALLATQIAASDVVGGSAAGAGTAFQWKSASVTPPTDGDYTLTAAEMSCYILSLAAGAWTSGHNIIVPAAAGGSWHVSNSSGFAATIKTAAGTGITIANARAATVRANGANIRRMSPDVDPSA